MIQIVFNDVDVATATDLLPLIPPQTGEKVVDDTSRYYLDSLMEFMVTQVSLVMRTGKTNHCGLIELYYCR